jgi:deoxyribose-phosphate aldolase
LFDLFLGDLMKSYDPDFFDEIAGTIEYILHDVHFNEQETLANCSIAKEYKIASVCVKPCYVRKAVARLRYSPVAVGTVIGSFHGANTTEVKVCEAKRALTDGALELEMFLNLGYLREGLDRQVTKDIHAVCGLAHMNGALVKVILDAEYLTKTQIMLGSQLTIDAGADYITISSKEAPSSANIELITAVRKIIGDDIQLKIIMGIDSRHNFIKFREVGCNRFGVYDLQVVMESLKA